MQKAHWKYINAHRNHVIYILMYLTEKLCNYGLRILITWNTPTAKTSQSSILTFEYLQNSSTAETTLSTYVEIF